MRFRLTILHLVFSLAVFTLAFFLKSAYPDYIHGAIQKVLLFYIIQGFVINLVIDWARHDFPDKLTLFLLGSVTFRMLTSLMACIFALLIGVNDRQMFIINFFAVYFIYLIFELTSLVANLRPNLNSH